MSENITRAIVLMNLGSPESTSVKDVRTYLNEFLMDERVIDYPLIPRFLLVKGIITPFRSPKSAEAYKAVWTKDGSPLVVLTRQVQSALQKIIKEPVAIAMRYGNPSPKKAFDELHAKYPHLKEVVLLPMYPHFAMSSYETAVVYAEELHKKGKYPFKLVTIKPYYDESNYLNALATSMQPYLQQEYDHIVFSYHGLPERHIHKDDITGNHCLTTPDCCNTPSIAHKQCYRHQVFTTTRLVADMLGIPKEKYSLSFQSRLGRAQWLLPYTVTRLAELPKQGAKKILVVCPAFVSDCLETLEEMAMQGKELFLESGGEKFTLIPCMNTHPQWIQTIATWMQQIGEGDTSMLYEKIVAHV